MRIQTSGRFSPFFALHALWDGSPNLSVITTYGLSGNFLITCIMALTSIDLRVLLSPLSVMTNTVLPLGCVVVRLH